MPPESDNSKQAPSEAATKGPLLSSVVELVNLNDDAKAIEGEHPPLYECDTEQNHASESTENGGAC